MSNTLINLLVIVIVLGTVALAIFTYLTNKKRKSGSLSNENTFKNWMAAQNFVPEHLSLFGGTGIAIKDGEDRVALQSRSILQFYPFSDITAIRAHQTTASARPLGAAPGVVEVKQFQLFNIDISIKNVADPVKILVENADLMQQWEQRLKTAAKL